MVGDLRPQISQKLGRDSPRCGSEAMTGAPEALRPGPTARELEPLRERAARSPGRASRASARAATRLSGPPPEARALPQASGHSPPPRRGSISAHISQVMSVPPTRDMVTRSSQVKGSGSMPSRPNSGGSSAAVAA